jgi:hypothetical protein
VEEERERPEYPWQFGLPPWALGAGATEAERRRRFCEFMFELEGVFREGGSPDPDLVYDAQAALYRFPDGRFALSREHADWPALKEAGYFSEWGM